MQIAIFQEQYPAGSAIPAGTASTLNDRVLNKEVENGIPGCTFDPTTGYVTLNAPDTYFLMADSASSDYMSLQTQIEVTSGTTLAFGMSGAGTLGPASQATQQSSAKGFLRVDAPVSIKVSSLFGAAMGTTPSICPVTGAAVDVGAQLIIAL